MTVSERAAARSVAAQQQRAVDEVRALVEGGLAVLRRHGAAGLTVAEVLAEAGLSTRAFYRHFQSKDELVLAVFEQEAQRRYAGLEAQLAKAASPRAALETWVDEMLSLGLRAPAGPAHQGARRRRGPRSRPTSPRSSRRSSRARCNRSKRCCARCRARIRHATRGRSTRSPGSSSSRSCAAPRSHGPTRAPTCCASACPAWVCSRERAVVNRPPVASEYYDTEYETMPRPQLLALQEQLLLEMLPYTYEHAPLIRETWDAAGVHPRDIRSLADFRAGAPFVSKDALRRFRDERNDPYGGLCALPPSELTAVMSTSGTTGDPTLVPEKWGGGGGKPTIITATSGAWACGPATTSRSCSSPSAAPPTGCSRDSARCRSCSTSIPRRWNGSANCRCGTGRPVSTTSVRSSSTRCVTCATRRGFDPADVFASYKGVVFAGEPFEPAGAGARRAVGRRALRAHGDSATSPPRSSATRTTGCISGRTPRWSRDSIPTAPRPWPTVRAASWSRPPCSTAPRRSSATARTTSSASPTLRASAGGRTRGSGRSAARATRSWCRAGRCCPSTCGPRSSRWTRARWGCSR